MARSYKRDKSGRFKGATNVASTGGSGTGPSKRQAKKVRRAQERVKLAAMNKAVKRQAAVNKITAMQKNDNSATRSQAASAIRNYTRASKKVSRANSKAEAARTKAIASDS